MKVTVEGFIVAKQYDWEDAPQFSWSRFDPTEWDKDSAIVCAHSIELEIPDSFDIRPARIAALERQRAEVRRKFAEEVAKLDEQIKKLLALPGASEVQA
jgi:hypothetical protein